MFNTDNGNFGVDNYPAYQHCSWSITVKKGSNVFLEFTTLKIPDCSGNELKIYDGVDSTDLLLATYCDRNATSGNTLRSTGNNVYVLFLSGQNKALQFQAQYSAQEPITGIAQITIRFPGLSLWLTNCTGPTAKLDLDKVRLFIWFQESK